MEFLIHITEKKLDIKNKIQAKNYSFQIVNFVDKLPPYMISKDDAQMI